jgi:hypothetical protein
MGSLLLKVLQLLEHFVFCLLSDLRLPYGSMPYPALTNRLERYVPLNSRQAALDASQFEFQSLETASVYERASEVPKETR